MPRVMFSDVTTLMTKTFGKRQSTTVFGLLDVLVNN